MQLMDTPEKKEKLVDAGITVNLFHKQLPQPYISKLLSLTSCK